VMHLSREGKIGQRKGGLAGGFKSELRKNARSSKGSR
jgi:hypothetical protein